MHAPWLYTLPASSEASGELETLLIVVRNRLALHGIYQAYSPQSVSL